ncbi:MAG: Rpn family recombination-promoting nuclease/putative transposase [Methanobacteriota archaeon]
MVKIPVGDDDFIMSPKNDFAFRLLFSDPHNKEILLDLINSILDNRIEDFELLNPHLFTSSTEREGILDIRARTDGGLHIDIEIQVSTFKAMEKRSIYYWALLYIEQLDSGHPYTNLNPTIAINILDYSFFGIEDFHTCFHAYDKKHELLLTDVFEIHFLELPKIDRVCKPYENASLFAWLSFLNAKNQKDFIMASEGKPAISKAYDLCVL